MIFINKLGKLRPVGYVCAVAALQASLAGASLDYYVDPAGNDGNSGTQSAPFKTIQKAASVVAAGGTVHVAPGVYTGGKLDTASGTASARIRFVSDTRWGAKLSDVVINGDYVDFEGFDVTGASSNVILNVAGNFSRAISNHVHNLPIACTSSSGGAGILFEGGVKNYTTQGQEAIGNLVEDVGSGPRDGSCRLVHGIYASVPGGKIENNVVRRATGDGITSWHGAQGLTIVNNTSVDNGGTGILIGSGESGAVTANTGTYVGNNVIYRNALNGIVESSDGTHIPSNNTYTANLLYGNQYDCISCATTSAVVSGTINADPLFVNVTGGDYHLTSGSPALDKGASRAPSTDFDGIARPQGNGIDLGAYERAQGTTQPPPTTLQVSGVTATVNSSSSATIVWSTTQPASSRVAYGPTSSYGSASALDSTLTTSHSVTLSGLSAATTYHYQVSSTNTSGSSAVSADATFTTASAPAPATVSIGSVSASARSTSAVVGWATNIATTGTVYYGTSPTNLSRSVTDTVANTSHRLSISGLQRRTVYYYRIKAVAGSASATSAVYSFRTTRY